MVGFKQEFSLFIRKFIRKFSIFSGSFIARFRFDGKMNDSRYASRLITEKIIVKIVKLVAQ